MTAITNGRHTADLKDEMVVFLIGMRINRLRALRSWLPAFRAMPRMLTELYRDPELGFVHGLLSRRHFAHDLELRGDLENSPRLQRIEQAIESIAVEVERIGEAQRFTTKLLADRQPAAAAHIGAAPRREPGSITPH